MKETDDVIKKVAVFYAQNDAFNKSETGTFQETVKQKGLELATVQTFQTTDTDFQSQVTNAINETCIESMNANTKTKFWQNPIFLGSFI